MLAALVLAQTLALTPADSSLVLRILRAEDRRDTADAALATGRRHADPRVQWLARRAYWRSVDSSFSARDSLPPLRAAHAWPEPEWKERFRALAPRRDDCAVIRRGLQDTTLVVRLRALDLVRGSCATDDSIALFARGLVQETVPQRGVWHTGAHALVALARLRPGEARPEIRRLVSFPLWNVRLYVARAAAIAFDTTTLRRLVRDPSDNVAEAAIEGLARLTSHADDSLFAVALQRRGAPVVRAAAIALKGTSRTDIPPLADRLFRRWVRRQNASERDVRVALLELAGRPPTADRPPPRREEVSMDAVRLALGAEARLRVEMRTGRSFVVRLRGDVAPIMAARVLALARRGYYDGTTWHRVEHDFVVQGGGHGANEYVGYAQYFREETGTLPHPRGTVGMSTRGHDTGDAQWFINLRDNPRLQRDYTVFAEVVDGMDVVDAILEGDAIVRIRPVPPR